jgi:hypothetical protein
MATTRPGIFELQHRTANVKIHPMNDLPQPPICANIRETNDGPYYEVMLYAVPQVGQLMKLYSYVEAVERNEHPAKHYEVVQVVHDVRDVSDKIPQSKGGYHFVTVFVKPSHSPLLRS